MIPPALDTSAPLRPRSRRAAFGFAQTFRTLRGKFLRGGRAAAPEIVTTAPAAVPAKVRAVWPSELT